MELTLRGATLYGIRERFKKAAGHTILPVFVVKNGKGWRPVNYEMDIVSRISWDQVDLKPVMELSLSPIEEKDYESIVTLIDDKHRVIDTKGHRKLKEGGIRADPVFMTRQLYDLVPNPWQAHEFAVNILTHFRKSASKGEDIEALIANNFVFLIEQLRQRLETERERLSEEVFRSMLAKDELRFLVIGNNFDWKFPKSTEVKSTAKKLTRDDGDQLAFSLYEAVSEDDFNDTERDVAWYLEKQQRLFFWFRNRERRDYSIQGWRKHRIYPDFIFTSTDKGKSSDYDRVYVVETKGLHLAGNLKTDYIRKIFDICTKQAKSKSWTELGLEMKDKDLRFEVLSEDEWEAKLNEILSI